MTLYTIKSEAGMGIVSAEDEMAAEDRASRQLGTSRAIHEVHEATDENIAWVQSMGGRIPKDQPAPKE